MRSMTWFVAAAVLLLLLAGSATPARANTCYFVKYYGSPRGTVLDATPDGDTLFLNASVYQVSGDSAYAAPDGYTSVTLDSLHGLGLLSPGEAEASGTTEPEMGAPRYWHYYDWSHLWRGGNPLWHYATIGSRIFCYNNSGPNWLGLASQTWLKRSDWPNYQKQTDHPRVVELADSIDFYDSFSHKWGYPYYHWWQKGWFDDGNLNNQVERDANFYW